MPDPWSYTYPSPLEGFEDYPTLSNDKAEDGKSFVNPPPTKKSDSYQSFPAPITNGRRGGFDLHIYFLHTNPTQLKYAEELWTRIRHEFPELRIYKLWDRPIGPHPIGMFEVNLFTPEQFGAFVPWLNIWRGPLSVLVHPNTDDEERDHTQRAIWLGERYPLDLSLFSKMREARAKGPAEKAVKEKDTAGANGTNGA